MTMEIHIERPSRLLAAFSQVGRNAGQLILSLLVFGAIWEFAWYIGWANPLLLPPPHIFLQNFLQQGKYFSTNTRFGSPPAFDVIVAMISQALKS